MLSGLSYLLRAAAALVVIFVGLAFLLLAVTTKEKSAVLLGVAAVATVGGALAWPRSPNAWRNDKPTERQIAFARDLGISIPKRVTKGELSDMIDQAKQIRDAF